MLCASELPETAKFSTATLSDHVVTAARMAIKLITGKANPAKTVGDLPAASDHRAFQQIQTLASA